MQALNNNISYVHGRSPIHTFISIRQKVIFQNNPYIWIEKLGCANKNWFYLILKIQVELTKINTHKQANAKQHKARYA